MSNDTSKQTLFRFVSLRNPQLTETEHRNLGFAFRPTGVGGHFDTEMDSSTETKKMTVLQNAAKTFTEDTRFVSEKKLEQSNFAELLKIGRKISKNQTLSANDLLATKNYYLGLQDTQKQLTKSGINVLSLIWDHLIYQTVTQKDFYVKEAIMQILKAIHLGFAQTMNQDEEFFAKNGEDYIAKALMGKVVLPSYLFIDGYIKDGENHSSTSKIFTVNESNISDAYIQNDPNALSTAQKERMKVEAQKLSDLNLAKLKKSALENLRGELKEVQKSYQKSYNKAYKNAYTSHQQTIAPIVQARDAELSSIEAQITPATTDAEKQQLYAAASVPEIPAFDFNYKNEINFSDLKSKLSENSLDAFLGLFAETDNAQALQNTTSRLAEAQVSSDTEMVLDNVSVSISEDYQTYQSIYDKLNQEIDSLSQTILSSSSVPQKQFAKIGGALVPVSTAKSSTHLAYTMAVNWFGGWFSILGSGGVQFSFDVEDDSWSLNLAKVTVETNNSNNVQETYTDIAVVDGKVMIPYTYLSDFRNVLSLRIELFFDNGREAILDFLGIVNNQIYPGIINLKPMSGSILGATNSFMPKHFGVKRLGIADYLKVEQSLHAYVPGEVSNIENVMASELRHKGSTRFTSSEVTDTTNKSIEKEHISDTTTATRNEMQSEVSNVLEQDRTAEAHASMRKDTVLFGHIEIGASYASHNSQQTSTRQAVTKAQEITNRALDRIVSKVTEERVVKIINQFTENNTHEFDNRNGKDHIAGVYRWVDKKMKNQIYNYGKRAMFEFMIPEPAKLHRLATVGEILNAPIDPRTATGEFLMKDYNVDDKILQHWADYYGIKLTQLPEINIQQNFPREDYDLKGNESYFHRYLEIKENYVANSATVYYGFAMHDRGGWLDDYPYNAILISNFSGGNIELPTRGGGDGTDDTVKFNNLNIKGTFDFLYKGINVQAMYIAVNMNCSLSEEYINSWKKLNFDAIIAKYKEAQTAFEDKQKEIAATQKDQTQNFYRDMEEVVLKHNCIAYLLQNYDALGTQLVDGTEMQNFKVLFDGDLDNYAALTKFMEQAFEWNIMSYTFYPYYWGSKSQWQEMYTTESVDPLFRNFLQAGMARVIVTVKPGFEDAVQFFMSTGRIWNGGEVPVIGDPLYLSIVDELREPVGVAQGKAWITRIPTTLNILQAKSIGLEVTNALPTSVENEFDFENPDDVETTSPFGEPKDVVLVGSEKESTLPKTITNVYNEKTIIQS